MGCDYTLNPYVGCGFACAFHQAKRDFQASPRQLALDLAREFGWGESDYAKSFEVLRRYLPDIRG